MQGKDAGTPGPAKEGTPNPKELEVTAQPGTLHWYGLLRLHDVLVPQCQVDSSDCLLCHWRQPSLVFCRKPVLLHVLPYSFAM